MIKKATLFITITLFGPNHLLTTDGSDPLKTNLTQLQEKLTKLSTNLDTLKKNLTNLKDKLEGKSPQTTRSSQRASMPDEEAPQNRTLVNERSEAQQQALNLLQKLENNDKDEVQVITTMFSRESNYTKEDKDAKARMLVATTPDGNIPLAAMIEKHDNAQHICYIITYLDKLSDEPSTQVMGKLLIALLHKNQPFFKEVFDLLIKDVATVKSALDNEKVMFALKDEAAQNIDYLLESFPKKWMVQDILMIEAPEKPQGESEKKLLYPLDYHILSNNKTLALALLKHETHESLYFKAENRIQLYQDLFDRNIKKAFFQKFLETWPEKGKDGLGRLPHISLNDIKKEGVIKTATQTFNGFMRCIQLAQHLDLSQTNNKGNTLYTLLAQENKSFHLSMLEYLHLHGTQQSGEPYDTAFIYQTNYNNNTPLHEYLIKCTNESKRINNDTVNYLIRIMPHSLIIKNNENKIPKDFNDWMKKLHPKHYILSEKDNTITYEKQLMYDAQVLYHHIIEPKKESYGGTLWNWTGGLVAGQTALLTIKTMLKEFLIEPVRTVEQLTGKQEIKHDIWQNVIAYTANLLKDGSIPYGNLYLAVFDIVARHNKELIGNDFIPYLKLIDNVTTQEVQKLFHLIKNQLSIFLALQPDSNNYLTDLTNPEKNLFFYGITHQLNKTRALSDTLSNNLLLFLVTYLSENQEQLKNFMTTEIVNNGQKTNLLKMAHDYQVSQFAQKIKGLIDYPSEAPVTTQSDEETETESESEEESESKIRKQQQRDARKAHKKKQKEEEREKSREAQQDPKKKREQRAQEKARAKIISNREIRHKLITQKREEALAAEEAKKQEKRAQQEKLQREAEQREKEEQEKQRAKQAQQDKLKK